MRKYDKEAYFEASDMRKYDERACFEVSYARKSDNQSLNSFSKAGNSTVEIFRLPAPSCRAAVCVSACGCVRPCCHSTHDGSQSTQQVQVYVGRVSQQSGLHRQE